MDLDDARVLLADLSWGKKVEFTDYKGSPAQPGNNSNGPQSRVLKIKANGDKVWLEIQNGPGEIIGQGAVKPKGKPTAAVSVPLTLWEARKLAHACLAYIRAWENEHLLNAASIAPSPSQGEGRGEGENGDTSEQVQASPRTPPSPPRQHRQPTPQVATKPAGQACPERRPEACPELVEGPVEGADRRVAAGVTTGEIEETVTGFWTFYNTTAKPAGVAYTHALDIANKHDSDWKTAIAKLRQAVAEGQPTV